MIFDTDVLIWYFRGNNKAREAVYETSEIGISAVTLMELIQGVRNKQELQLLHKFLTTNSIRVFYLTSLYLNSNHSMWLNIQGHLDRGKYAGDILRH